MCYRVTITSGRGVIPRTPHASRAQGGRPTFGRGLARESRPAPEERAGRAGQGACRQRPADRAAGARGLPEAGCGTRSAPNARPCRPLRLRGVTGGTAPRQPLRGTREVWPRGVGWLSRLSGVRQARPPRPRRTGSTRRIGLFDVLTRPHPVNGSGHGCGKLARSPECRARPPRRPTPARSACTPRPNCSGCASMNRAH